MAPKASPASTTRSALTDSGRELIDRAFEAHMANEHRLVAPLNEMEQARLAHLLEVWGRAIDT